MMRRFAARPVGKDFSWWKRSGESQIWSVPRDKLETPCVVSYFLTGCQGRGDSPSLRPLRNPLRSVQIAHFVEDFSGARRLRRLTSPTAFGAFRLVAHRSGVHAALLLLRLRRVASSASNQGPRPAAWITAFFPGSKASTTCG